MNNAGHHDDARYKKIVRQKKVWIGIAILEFLIIISLYVVPLLITPIGFDAVDNHAHCYEDDEEPPKNYLKLTLELKAKKEARFRAFKLDNLDYTRCLQNDDAEISLTTYIDTTGIKAIPFFGNIRSVNANENKFTATLVLSTQQDSVISTLKFTKTIYGTVTSVSMRGILPVKKL